MTPYPDFIQMFTDCHTHNLEAGIDAIINLPQGEYAPLRPDRFYSIGVHPWDTNKPYELDKISNGATDSQIVAIGECGLDAKQGATLDIQEEIFRWHIALSEHLCKPLIVHAVHTHQRIIELRKELKPKQKWIIHGFRGKPQLAQALIKAGCDISVGHHYNPAILGVVPSDRLHHESDDNY